VVLLTDLHCTRQLFTACDDWYYIYHCRSIVVRRSCDQVWIGLLPEVCF